MHNNTARRIAVAGATGRLGRHVADLLSQAGYSVVPMSRATGVDVISGSGLVDALKGVDAIIDAATGPSPEQLAATQFFTTAARNLQEYGAQAGVQRIVVVSIIGCDRFTAGYGAAKLVHEKATQEGPIPASILRAAQFHEFVAQLLEWGRQGEVTYVQQMRTQIVAARTVASALIDLATSADLVQGIPEIAGPREESLVELAKLLVEQRGRHLRIEGVTNPADPDDRLYMDGSLLPGSHATLAGPTFEAWLYAEAATAAASSA